MKAVIMQPTYLPWMGYFDLIDQSNIFVFLDDVQFEKQSWQQRNKIKTPHGMIWLTVPVLQNLGQKINEVKINNNSNWKEKHWKSIKYNYSNSSHFNEHFEFFEYIYGTNWGCLADLNMTLIEKSSRILGLDTKFIFSSELNVGGKKTDRLINILNETGADEYISTPGSKSYIEVDKFNKENIMLYWNEFNHQTYTQLYGDFMPYLSVIDLLFNCGDKSLSVIRKGGGNAIKRA